MKVEIGLSKNDSGDYLIEFHCGSSIHHFVIHPEAARELAEAILKDSEKIVPATVVDITKIRPRLVKS